MSDATWKDRLFVSLQQALPTRALSVLMQKLTRITWAPLKNAHIRLFMRGFDISLAEAEREQPEDYVSFNDFFTRALKPGARPLPQDPAHLISPVDGTVSQVGPVRQGRVFQAKGHSFSLDELLGGPAGKDFEEGAFCTIYLAPYNYHRIHMPKDGQLREWRHVPGRLFSVNPPTVRTLPGVFARNERLVSLFEGRPGSDPWALVMVGALFVGSMETVWAEQVTPPYAKQGEIGSYQPSKPVQLRRGDEMGRFNMGSTVILVFPKGTVHWDDRIQPGTTVRMGQTLGRLFR